MRAPQSHTPERVESVHQPLGSTRRGTRCREDEFVSYDASGDFCVPKGKTPGAARLFLPLLKNRNSTRFPDGRVNGAPPDSEKYCMGRGRWMRIAADTAGVGIGLVCIPAPGEGT